MKILIVNKFLYPYGGSETYIFTLGRQLCSMGHEVQYFGMEHECRVVGNHMESYTSNMDFHGGGLQKLLYPFRIIYSREARKKIRIVLDDFKPDVVHLNNFNFQITPSVIYEIKKWEKGAGRRVPIIYTAHDYQWICPNHMLMIPENGRLCFACRGARFINCTKNRCIHGSGLKSLLGTIEAELYYYLRVYDKINQIICPSHFMEKMLSDNPVLAKRTVTLYNFLEKEENISSGKKDYVLYFGRYTEEKGVLTLLKVCENLPGIPFVFAGSGPLKENVGKHKNITDLGFLQGKDLKKVIAEARFSIFPSQWYENCPFSVMESQSQGTPVIASSMGGVPELVQDKVTGELFEAGNTAELTDRIRRLWSDRELCENYAGNCRAVRFDTSREYCDKLLDIYKKFM